MLYVSNNPEKDIIEMSNDLYNNCPNLDRLYNKYVKEMMIYNKNITRIEKQIKNEDRAEKEKQRLNIPILKWPDEYVINTIEHLKKYNKNIINIDNKLLKSGYLEISEDKFNIIPSPFDKLLVSRIGIYNPNNKQFTTSYTNLVNRFANKNELSVLASDAQIVYGTNYPLTEVVIDSSFGQQASSNTLYQLIGRAGRTGKSELATVVFTDDDTLNKAFTNIKNNIEAETICFLANKIIVQ